MPKRIASMSKRIAANGRALHQARAESAAGSKGGEAEAALVAERKQLKEELAKRKERALLPGPSALDRLVRTHRPEAKDKDRKAKKDAPDAAGVKKPKAQRSRAEKQAEKAAALDAARRSPKKPAK